jgi:hypothetical protein
MAAATSSNSPLTVQEGGTTEKLNRSCEGCRTRKIRCQPTTESQSGCCVRCQKMKLNCIFQAPTVKRRKKRTDVRVMELEKELRALRDRLEKNEAINNASLSSASDPEPNMTQSYNGSTFSSTRLSETPLGLGPALSISGIVSSDVMITDDVEIDEATTQLLFRKFMVDLIPHLPFVHFSPDTTSELVQRNRPTFHLAALAAAAATLYPPLGRKLAAKIEKVYATRVIINGEKSLDLVQALLITAIWYHPPDRFEDLKFTQYAHMAANMALDLQIGRKTSFDTDNSESDDIEAIRTFAACYVLCSRFLDPYCLWKLRLY